MKFSIITVSYNQATYLEQCILSVLDQGDEDIEYIVIDGGSTDDSVSIIERYADRISYWVSEPDKGPANALNKGLDRATGDWIGFINSDDYLLPHAFSSLSTEIQSNPSFDVFYGPGYIKDEIKNNEMVVHPTLWHLGCYRAGMAVLMQQSIFIRSRYFKNGLRFNEKNTTHWDGELLVDLDLAGARFYKHSIPLSVFRIHGESITGKGGEEKARTRYQQEQAIVDSKIDQAHPGFIRLKLYWAMWLFLFDNQNLRRRVLRKILR